MQGSVGEKSAWRAEAEQIIAAHDGDVALLWLCLRLDPACGLEDAPDDSRPKGGMIDISVAREEDDINLIPSPELQLLLRRRQKVRQPIFSHLLPLTSHF